MGAPQAQAPLHPARRALQSGGLVSEGFWQALDTIARSVLGVGLADIANALPR